MAILVLSLRHNSYAISVAEYEENVDRYQRELVEWYDDEDRGNSTIWQARLLNWQAQNLRRYEEKYGIAREYTRFTPLQSLRGRDLDEALGNLREK